MQNYIIWNGNDSRDIKGLLISELPPITKPQMRHTETLIDGVDGSLIEDLGYEAYDKPLTIGLTAKADVDEIIKYFTGKGEVIFSNEPLKYYKATIVGRIDYARLGRFKTASVIFKVQPFKYATIEDVVSAGRVRDNETVYLVENLGLENSKPLLRLMGEGRIECKVNGSPVFEYTFPEGVGEVYIDSEKQDAFLEDVLLHRHMIGDFPLLESGVNEISFTGTLSLVEITARSRWL